MEPVHTTRVEAGADDVDCAVIEDNLKRHWVVRAPRNTAAGVRMEQESDLIEQLMSWLPFGLPQAEGTAPLPSGGRAVVHRRLPGHPIRPLELLHRPGLAIGYGQAVAAIHDLPIRLVCTGSIPRMAAEASAASASGDLADTLPPYCHSPMLAGNQR